MTKKKTQHKREEYEINGPVELEIFGLWTKKSTSAQAPKKASDVDDPTGIFEPRIQDKRRVKLVLSQGGDQDTTLDPQLKNPLPPFHRSILCICLRGRK